ncbi:MAG: hypothetical protein ACYTHM_05615 [Planctomycetota bacterium]|jgi:hypothetical protein
MTSSKMTSLGISIFFFFGLQSVIAEDDEVPVFAWPRGWFTDKNAINQQKWRKKTIAMADSLLGEEF